MANKTRASAVFMEPTDRVVAVCHRCGTGFNKRKGYFPVSYSAINKGVGFLPVCKKCLEDVLKSYYDECGDYAIAMRQVCRKFDLYWNESIFDRASKKSTYDTIANTYATSLTTANLVGKTYDDTLKEEGITLDFFKENSAEVVYRNRSTTQNQCDEDTTSSAADVKYDISDDVRMFWGSGCTDEMCYELQQRFDYWASKLGGASVLDADIGTQMLLKQICSVEIDINRDRKDGKPTDKNMNILNTLLGSAKLKPVQKEDGDSTLDSTPLGVWAKLWENGRPIPEPDPELQDVDGIRRYITIWFFGHLCKMLGVKNSYCKMYEEEIAKMRVEAPQYDDEDDDEFLNDVLSGGDDNE